MKRQLLPTVALGLALLLPTSSWASHSVPPKTWRGTIQIAKHSSSGVTGTAFVSNGCKWQNPALNGLDAVVFDVYSHRGLAGKVTWNTTIPVKPTSVFGSFRTASCALTGATWQHTQSGTAKSFTFPARAKWLIVQPVTNVPSRDIAVTISSPGRRHR